MMKRKAVFLDRDDTINVDTGYVHKIEDFRFISGAIQGIKDLRKSGFLVIVVTNQSGIGRGFYTEKDVRTLHDYINRELKNKGTGIDRFYFCPHHPEASIEKYRKDCDCRKPNPGMILQAIAELDIDARSSYMIGDRLRDIAAGKRAGLTSILIRAEEKNGEDSAIGDDAPDQIVKNLSQAVDYVLKRN